MVYTSQFSKNMILVYKQGYKLFVLRRKPQSIINLLMEMLTIRYSVYLLSKAAC